MTDKLKVKFHPVDDFIGASVPPPKPARFYIPDWFKMMPAIPEEGQKYKDGKKPNSVKQCMPYLDCFMTGYIQETWCDIQIDVHDDGSCEYYFANEPNIINHREPMSQISDMYYQWEFLWKQPWGIETPKGWSSLITQPLNQAHLPFETMSGIMETDTYYRLPFPNNVPFLLKKGFNGVIPAGTPMFQIIPFQRQEWEHEICQYDEYAHLSDLAKVRRYFSNGYKRAHWKRKVFV